MNWTGGALKHYSGKSYRNRNQAFAQRQHFSRLRKGRGKKEQEKKVFGSQRDPGGDENGVWRAFVPEWERRPWRGDDRMGRYEVEEEEAEKRTYGSMDCEVKTIRDTGQKKTLKEFEELIRVKEQRERKKGKEYFKWREKSRKWCFVPKKYGSEDDFHWDLMSDDRLENENENDDQAENHNGIRYSSSDYEELAHQMQYLLRHDDWAGLKYCRIDTDCAERNRNLSRDSNAIDKKSMSATKNRSRHRKRKRQCEVNDFEADRDVSTKGDHSLGKRYGKLVPMSDCRSSGCGHPNFTQLPLPMHRLSRRTRWQPTTEPIDKGENIRDEDISIRIGSNALRSETSSSYFPEREKGSQRTETTESCENESEAEDEEEECSDNVIIEENDNTKRIDRINRNTLNSTRRGFRGILRMDTISSESLSLIPETSHNSSERGGTQSSEDICKISKRRKRQIERQTCNRVDKDVYSDRGESKCLLHYHQPYHNTLRTVTSNENSSNENEEPDMMTNAIDNCSMHEKQISSVCQSEENSIGETDGDLKLLGKSNVGICTQDDSDYTGQAGSAVTEEDDTCDLLYYTNETV